MPTPRKLIVRTALSDGGAGEAEVFHCLSRVVDRNFVFGEAEREAFSRMMRATEAFSGVRVLAWTILSNHFHLLLEVPEKPAGFELEEGEFWRRIGALYSAEEVEGIRGTLRSLATTPGGAAGELMARDYRRRFLDRMLDLSEFMKTLKQRFTVWFNRRNERVGTLWESRFKAVLVEGSPETLMKVSAYIDLNAVRAGMVSDPKDYRWCGYAEALGARKKAIRERARGAMRVVMGEEGNPVDGQGSTRMRVTEERRERNRMLAEYRKLLFGAGDETMTTKGGFTQERVEAIFKEGGKLTLAQLLRCRVRHFSDGLVLGSRAFVNRYFEGARESFGSRRTSGARKVRGSDDGGLYAVRDLQKAGISGQ
jgi:REP element-mobilizing transposase RayT